MVDLAKLLTSDAPYLAKLEALQVAQDAADPGLLDLVRERIPCELDPFVLSRLAAILGAMGELTDGPLLVRMLDFPEPRVVSNALESLDRLGILLEVERLEDFTRSDDARVAGTALASLASIQPTRAFQIIRERYPVTDTEHRRAYLHTLGSLASRQEARDLLVNLIALESRTTLLKVIAQTLSETFVTLRKHDARRLVGQLHFLRGPAGIDRTSLVEQLLHDLCTAAGWVREDIEKIVREGCDASGDETVA